MNRDEMTTPQYGVVVQEHQSDGYPVEPIYKIYKI